MKQGILKRLVLVALCVLMVIPTAACGGGTTVSESNSPSDITELPSGDIPPVDEKPVSGPNEPNTPVIIPEPPEKPVVNPLDYSPYGRPAPQWLRDAETATAHIGMDSEELIQEWGYANKNKT